MAWACGEVNFDIVGMDWTSVLQLKFYVTRRFSCIVSRLIHQFKLYLIIFARNF